MRRRDVRERFHVASHAPLIARPRIDRRTAQRMPEQARGDRVTGFVSADPPILLFSAAERGEELVVFIDLNLEAAAIAGVTQSGAGCGAFPAGEVAGSASPSPAGIPLDMTKDLELARVRARADSVDSAVARLRHRAGNQLRLRRGRDLHDL
jgi:hypothetical protein